MNQRIKKLIWTMDNRHRGYFLLPPFLLWHIVKYPIIGLFGVEIIIEQWENENSSAKFFLAIFYFIGLIIARSMDLTRLMILLLAELLGLFYVPIIENIYNAYHKANAISKTKE